MTRPWRENLVGQTFGRLEVIEQGQTVNGLRHWLCRCICGNTCVVAHSPLKNGKTKSCGCLRKEVARERMTTHGNAARGMKSRAYKIWSGMIARCTIPSATGYERYGGAGVSVCERWRHFENFLEDMGNPPAGMSIDRIKSELGYSKENCRWATRQTQNENRRNVRIVAFNGKTMNITQWAKYLGLSKATVAEALDKHPPEIALRDRGRSAERGTS